MMQNHKIKLDIDGQDESSRELSFVICHVDKLTFPFVTDKIALTSVVAKNDIFGRSVSAIAK